MLKKSLLFLGLIIYFSITLTTSSPFQNNNLFEGNTISFPENNSEFVYAEKDKGGDDGDKKKDKGGDNDKGGDDGDKKKDKGGDNDKGGDDGDKKKDKGGDNDKGGDERKDDSFTSGSNDDNEDKGNNNDNNDKKKDKDENKEGTTDTEKSNKDATDDLTETSSVSFSQSDGNPPSDGNPTIPPGNNNNNNNPTIPPGNNNNNPRSDNNLKSSSKDFEDFKKKINNENKVVTKKISKNKVVMRDYENNEKEVIIVSNKNKCPTQSGTVGLTGKISPKGIRLLADFDPCKIEDGSVTLNIPNSQNIKLAAVYIDTKNNNHAATLLNPLKI
jgi:hypothetical protein